MSTDKYSDKAQAHKAFGPCPVEGCKNTRRKYMRDCGEHDKDHLDTADIEQITIAPAGNFVVKVDEVSKVEMVRTQKDNVYWRCSFQFQLEGETRFLWIYGFTAAMMMIYDSREWWIGREIKIRVKHEQHHKDPSAIMAHVEYRGLA